MDHRVSKSVEDWEKPIPERQLRPLTGLEPEQQRAVWKQAVSKGTGRLRCEAASDEGDKLKGEATRGRRRRLAAVAPERGEEER